MPLSGEARRGVGWVHEGSRAPLLPGEVPAQWRASEPLRDGQRLGRTHDGHVQHEAATDLWIPARDRSSAVRDRGQLLPGGLRWFVPEPSVADCCRDAQVEACGERWIGERPALYRRHQWDADRVSVLQGDQSRKGCAADGAGRTGRAGGAALRRLRGQYDPADVSAVLAGHRPGEATAAADGRHDWRSTERKKDRLGLVLRWMVEREWRYRCAGLDEWRRAVVQRSEGA